MSVDLQIILVGKLYRTQRVPRKVTMQHRDLERKSYLFPLCWFSSTSNHFSVLFHSAVEFFSWYCSGGRLLVACKEIPFKSSLYFYFFYLRVCCDLSSKILIYIIIHYRKRVLWLLWRFEWELINFLVYIVLYTIIKIKIVTCFWARLYIYICLWSYVHAVNSCSF